MTRKYADNILMGMLYYKRFKMRMLVRKVGNVYGKRYYGKCDRLSS